MFEITEFVVTGVVQMDKDGRAVLSDRRGFESCRYVATLCAGVFAFQGERPRTRFN